MDIVSQLIEENVRRAQNINSILNKNESQLKNFKINTTVLHKNNKYSENIIKSFSSFYSRIKNWFYYEDSIIPKDHKKENTNIEKIDLEELKEISINIQNLLEKQNKELEELNLDVLNENIIIKNNTKLINKLI
tara:strand:+ start:250 stop:651 length:402 start_codon:yes stop_codon:yes gene_type:complete